jgi:hypothetical protein
MMTDNSQPTLTMKALLSLSGQFAPGKSLRTMKPIKLCLFLVCMWAGLSAAWAGTPATITAIYPPQMNINAGAHCTFIVSAAGTAPFSYQWAYNGTPMAGATTSVLALTNLVNASTISNAGTYTVTVTNLATTNAGAAPAVSNAVLTVYSGLYPLSSSNLAVLRNGDGTGAPNANTGNALYIDQIQTDGTYISTLMIPDETNTPNFPTNSEMVCVSSTFMNQSADGLYLVFYGYHAPRPYSGGNIGATTAVAVPRAAGSVSGLGYYTLAGTTSTSYGGDTLNDVASADGLTDFYFSASAGGCVLVQPGLPDVQITPISGFGPGNGAGRQNGIYGGYLWFAANAALNPGLFTWNGTGDPLPTNSGVLPFDVVPNPSTIASQNPNDFVFSPDGQTIYACSGSQTGPGFVGGIQRWDNDTPYGLSGWTMTYNLTNIPEFGTTGNNGPDGITIDFSGWTNGGGPGVWGSGTSNAIIYFTTGQQTNVMKIVDNNSANSTFSNPLATIIATVGPNQQWHGIRFCPATLAASIVTQPSSNTNAVPGSTATFTVGTTGSQPLIYQWYGPSGLLSNGGNISGANSSTLTITGVSTANVGAYYVSVSNVPPTSLTSATVTLALSTNDPAVAIPPTNTSASYGGIVTFKVVPYGAGPFSYQWQGPNGPVNSGPSGTGSFYSIVTNFGSGVTNSVLTISNVSCQDNGNYFVTVGDSSGSVMSTNGVLTVKDPIIITQPVSQFAFLNGTAVFNVTAAGSGTLSYQWLSNGIAMTDGGDISGSSTSTLTISPATSQNTANYSVTVSGTGGCNSGQTVTSSLAPFTAAFPPQSRTVTAGALVSFVAGGGTNFQWSYNGTNISSATNASITFTNVQSSSAGTYGISMNSGALIANATLTVVPGLFRLYPTNLVVFRQGDGGGALANTGNIIYLDQYTTNGTYLNTTMIPYTGSSELLCNSGPTDGYMSMSANGQYLNFPGYVASRPYSSSISAATSTNVPRGIGAVNGFGYFTRPVTDTTLFSTFNFNDVCSSDGLTNFWGAGNGGLGLFYVSPGQPDVLIAAPTNNPGFGNNKEVNIISGHLYCTSGSGNVGLYDLGPEPTSLISSNLSPIALDASPNDFTISPDFQTIYITDGANVNPPGGAGGIERFDLVGGSYQLQYTIPTTTQPGQTGNDGPDGLLVDFSAHATWGQGVAGAVIYTTTGSTTQNYLDRIVDNNGASSTATVLAFAGPNQGMRDVRFGPSVVLPVSITAEPQSQTNVAGNTATFTVSATGSGPLQYQWQFNSNNIAGATSSSLILTDIQSANAGNYSVIVSNLISSTNSTVATLTVTPLSPPQFQPAVLQPNGTLQLKFSGTTGANYRLWATTNAALTPIQSTWTLLSSGTFGSGTVTYVDTASTNFTRRFYVITDP